ncbi:MAG: hypothetical protein QM493_07580 [Sulfurovum sp.]
MSEELEVLKEKRLYNSKVTPKYALSVGTIITIIVIQNWSLQISVMGKI